MSRQPTKKDLDLAIRDAGKNRYANSLVDAYHCVTAQGQYQGHPYLADVVTLSSTITAAGNCNRPDLLVDAYHRATAQGQYQGHPYLANVVTLNSTITAAGNCNRMGLAEEAFRILLACNQDNVVTHANFNYARQKNPPSDPTTRYRHNPYSFICSWEANNTTPSTSAELNHVARFCRK